MILEGKSAIVTGAGRGLGRAVALGLAAAGAQVMVNDIPQAGGDGPARQVAREIEGKGGISAAQEGDVSREPDVIALVKAAVERFGKLDILVNNAGNSAPAMLHTMTLDQWNRVLAVHLTGSFLCMREAAKHMMERKEGRIINVVSVAGLQGSVGQPNYAAAKAGVIGLTKSGAKELSRYNIRVNAVSLGAISTDMTARILSDPKLREMTLQRILLRKVYEPEEVVPVFVFLASDGAQSFQGQVLSADGGIAGLG